MTDLSTTYLGLRLAHPIVASAGPLTGRLDSLHELEDAGAAAVVLPSLFQEEIEHVATEVHGMLSQGVEQFAEALTYLPELDDYGTGPDRHVELVAEAKAALGIPVIASLNGTTTGGWTRYARDLAAAGADALELNVYLVAADADHGPDAVERYYCDLVHEVAASVEVPVAVKVGPYFSAFTHLARRLAHSGADGLVCFNRFYQPDLDVEALEVTAGLELSTSHDLLLPLRWVAILRDRVDTSLALSGGVHSPIDAVKAVLAGADVVMTTSALLRHGPTHVGALRDGLAAWFREHEYESIEQGKGSMSQRSVPDPDTFERANYVTALRKYSSRFLLERAGQQRSPRTREARGP